MVSPAAGAAGRPRNGRSRDGRSVIVAQEIWSCLSHIHAVNFVAHSQLTPGWNGRGSGTVTVERLNDDTLVFYESGVWQSQGSGEIEFSNIFRWSRVGAETIRLEHLRYGPDQPVYLFDLVAADHNEWKSVKPHLCREDIYAARLFRQEQSILMNWTITGPKKQETLEYNYYQ